MGGLGTAGWETAEAGWEMAEVGWGMAGVGWEMEEVAGWRMAEGMPGVTAGWVGPGAERSIPSDSCGSWGAL